MYTFLRNSPSSSIDAGVLLSFGPLLVKLSRPDLAILHPEPLNPAFDTFGPDDDDDPPNRDPENWDPGNLDTDSFLRIPFLESRSTNDRIEAISYHFCQVSGHF